ncbi:MAG: alpha/beta fold hydrolase [Candidatus Saccharimonadales bacterium]
MTPDAYTIKEYMLSVGHGHTLYVHDWGNKKVKKPIIFLHGGPGGQSKDKHKTPFDPKTQRVVFFDQRGSGRSTPLGRWQHNTTQELAADITAVADNLKIDRFILIGGSWGSCLALYYAICNPGRVLALAISGVFTGSQAEIDWLDKGLFKTHFPEAWERYVQATPTKHRDDPSVYHFAAVTGSDKAEAARSARAYGDLEGAALSLDDTFTPISADDFDPTGMSIEMRYLAKRCFLPDRFIMKNARTLRMPVYIVQGRYDFVCPPSTAYELSKLLPASHLSWVTSGHRAEHETITAQRLIYKHLTEK